MIKIAVFGGTFNPVHKGHIHLANRFAQILRVDRVLLIPASIPPHKRAPALAPGEDRLAMCRLACGTSGVLKASGLEIRRGGLSYTSDTLRELKALYPDSELYLITGEDMFLTLEQWHEADMIFSLATVYAAPRSRSGSGRLREYASALARKGARTRVEDIRYLPVSSTRVREAVRKGENISAYVPEPVARYISEKHLYLG